jgi:hypothetical protein
MKTYMKDKDNLSYLYYSDDESHSDNWSTYLLRFNTGGMQTSY